MSAALTISVLLAISVAIVRIASVAMRLTGLPDNVARLQSVSALTGAGFTTRESEMIVNYPIRRKVLVFLMVLGNLGLISVGSTFIVALVGTDHSANAIMVQSLTIAAAICVTFVIMTNKHLDRVMCNVIGVLLSKTTTLGQRPYERTLQLDEGLSIAEHRFRGPKPQPISALGLADYQLMLLAVRVAESHEIISIDRDRSVAPGDSLICYGSDAAHDQFGLTDTSH